MLEVLICTFNERIRAVPQVFLPLRDDVKYLVSWQYTDSDLLQLLPAEITDRSDVSLHLLEGKGLSANRNNALRHATGDVLLIADDDVRYEQSYFDRIINAFHQDSSLDVAAFQAQTFDGRPFRRYSSHSFRYQAAPRGTYYVSFEIALRRRASLPHFDERFGLEAPFLGSGEEEVFVFEAARRGLVVRYIPEVVVKAPTETTRTRFWIDPRVQRSKGAVLCLMHGPWGAWLRCLKFALTHRPGPHTPAVFWQMWRGINYVRS